MSRIIELKAWSISLVVATLTLSACTMSFYESDINHIFKDEIAAGESLPIDGLWVEPKPGVFWGYSIRVEGGRAYATQQYGDDERFPPERIIARDIVRDPYRPGVYRSRNPRSSGRQIIYEPGLIILDAQGETLYFKTGSAPENRRYATWYGARWTGGEVTYSANQAADQEALDKELLAIQSWEDALDEAWNKLAEGMTFAAATATLNMPLEQYVDGANYQIGVSGADQSGSRSVSSFRSKRTVVTIDFELEFVDGKLVSWKRSGE